MPPKDRVIAEIFRAAPEGLMKTAPTIPWEAVVNGCPPSKAKRLPLVLSGFCANIDPTIVFDVLNSLARLSAQHSPHAGFGASCDDPDAIAQQLSFAMISRAANSILLELPLPQHGHFAMLTSDGESSLILQASAISRLSSRLGNPHLRRDVFARAYIARYARLNADFHAFVANEPTEETDRNFNPSYQFLNPTSWGFSPTSTQSISSMHWTAHNLFRHPTSPKSPPQKSTATRQRFKDIFEEPTVDRGDPFQCIPQLRQFRNLAQADAAHAQNLALALGRCRLFGVRLNDTEDFTLSPLSFDRAATSLIDELKQACKWNTEIQSKADTYSPYLHRNLALELLEIRMDAHATYLALDEAYTAATYESEPTTPAMGRRLNQVRRVINLFDGNLQKQLPLLRLAASTFLLENWRRLLAPTYRDLPPWWLDGCLEQ